MARIFIGIGSNIEPEKNVKESIRLLSFVTCIAGISTFYKTKAEERPEQASFYNGVVEISAGLSPVGLKYHILRPIEDRLGRVRGDDRNASRTIDLDLLLYDDLAIDTFEIKLPDPDLFRRPYLALPLAELAPKLLVPGTAMTIEEAVRSVPVDNLEALEAYTEGLRREFLK